MSARYHIAYVFILCLITSCGEDQINKSLQQGDPSILAVEGVLTNEKTNHLIRLSHPYNTLNGEPVPATGALVQIGDGTNIYLLNENPIGSGNYYTPELRAAFGLTYTLVINYQNKEYIASDSSVPVEPLTAIDYRKSNDGYELNLSPTGQSANYIDHAVSWKNTEQCTLNTSCEGRLVYYDLKTIDVNEIFKPDKLPFVFPLHSVVIRKKYSTSIAYKNFLRSMLSETEWRGGVFDVDRANTTTNLSNGAVGFFAVSTVVSDTTQITEKP